jgi:hypothetical protein
MVGLSGERRLGIIFVREFYIIDVFLMFGVLPLDELGQVPLYLLLNGSILDLEGDLGLAGIFFGLADVEVDHLPEDGGEFVIFQQASHKHLHNFLNVKDLIGETLLKEVLNAFANFVVVLA